MVAVIDAPAFIRAAELERLPAEVLDSGRMVLFVGRLERRKGVDLILEAATSILRSDATARFDGAGVGVMGCRPEKSTCSPCRGRW